MLFRYASCSYLFFFFSSRRRHTRLQGDWSSDVCSSDLRSTQVILDAANGVIAENARRLGKTLFTATPGGEPVTLLTAADERDEAEWLAGGLARRAAEAGVPYGGMAVPYPTHPQSRPLEEAVLVPGVPHPLVGAGGV